jgi:hypothetical protein
LTELFIPRNKETNKQDQNEITELTIFPNPTQSGLITLNIDIDKEGFYKFHIVNIDGSYSKSNFEENYLVKGENTKKIDISNLENGIYILTVRGEKSVKSIRIIKI